MRKMGCAFKLLVRYNEEGDAVLEIIVTGVGNMGLSHNPRNETPVSGMVSHYVTSSSQGQTKNLNKQAGLGEFRIRDLNDEINKLLREKGHWETQIRDLGGPDYARVGPRMLDHEGKEVPGNRGYKYFGAAKELPGVRELFEQEPPPPPRKTRGELMKDIDADYYGYRDDDDGVLLPIEAREEKKAIQAAVSEWKTKKLTTLNNETEEKMEEEEEEEENIYSVTLDDSSSGEDDDKDGERDSGQPRFIAHVPVPSQREVEQALLQRKKQELLNRYASDTVVSQAEEAKELLGVSSSSTT
ncbi:NineTeen Complex (NTC) component [Homalodisca vitripennis]|nr:NineTeen Complex (NTC) component [Homalodisca vitripennis]